MTTSIKNKSNVSKIDNETNVENKNVSIQKKNSKKPLLTICIPTYNRAKFLKSQIETATSFLLDRDDIEAELVVVNNVSKDETKEILSKIKHPKIKIINRTTHYDTAEENIMRSIEYISGEYVWFLGDDDPIAICSLDIVINALKSGKYDTCIFNSTTIKPQGGIELLQPMTMNGHVFEGNIGEIVQSIGLIYTFAGLSNIIQKTSNLSTENGINWLKVSKIYSHVAWFIHSNKDSHVGFFNMPLVYYRQNDYSDGHWDRVAEKLKVQNLYFWSLGIVRLLEKLIEYKCLNYYVAGGIFELAGNGMRYRLVDDILYKTFTQIKTFCNTDEKRQILTANEFEEIRSFLTKADPLFYDSLELLKDARNASESPDSLNLRPTIAMKLDEKFHHLYNLRQFSGQFSSRFIGKFYNFETFKMPTKFVAVYASNDTSLRETTLRIVDPLADDYNVIVEENFDILIEKAKNAQQKRDEFGIISANMPGSSESIVNHINVPFEEMRRISDEHLSVNRSLVNQLTEVYNSSSWRLSSPIRSIGKLFKR